MQTYENDFFLLVIASGLATASCNKTYECKNQTGIITCEVKASSQSKANSLCEANGAISATKK